MLTVLLADKENKRLFISNRNGQVYIYDISPVNFKIISDFLKFLNRNLQLCFILFKLTLRELLEVFSSIMSRTIWSPPITTMVLSLWLTYKSQAKKSSLTTLPVSLVETRSEESSGPQAELKSTLVVKMVPLLSWMLRKPLLFVKFSWKRNNLLIEKLDALKAHNDGVTKLQLLDKESILITGGKDKQIKVKIGKRNRIC